jgi:dTDP-4-amino-4,6-dideoxygalactose transaminase
MIYSKGDYIMPKQIPFIKPKFPAPEDLAKDLQRIYENNFYSNNGPVYFEFKEKLETYLGQGVHAVVVSNATMGLMLSIEAIMGKQKNKKKYIAIPAFTFAAGPLAIRWCGFEPLFFDVDATSAQPDLRSFQSVLDDYSQDLAGVVLINDFGIGNPEIEKWDKLLSYKDIPYIIDSAPGFGSTYENGELIGGMGACEVFSFHATKPFGIGEGGLITTKDAELAEKLEVLKNFGFDDTKRTVGAGINAKITELDCAIGLRILSKYPETLADRRKTYARFEANLKASDIKFLPRAASASIQFATILVDSNDQKMLINQLKVGGVEARTYYAPAVNTFPYFANAPKVDLSNTELLSKKVISLPVHPDMEPSTVDYICDIIIRSLDKG